MKCEFIDCKTKVLYIIGECKYCKFSFCGAHRLPEFHNCIKLDDYKKLLKRRLEEKLNEERIPKRVNF
jgi:predicted nucleic acid binding AN1-type Zn finger protein